MIAKATSCSRRYFLNVYVVFLLQLINFCRGMTFDLIPPWAATAQQATIILQNTDQSSQSQRLLWRNWLARPAVNPKQTGRLKVRAFPRETLIFCIFYVFGDRTKHRRRGSEGQTSFEGLCSPYAAYLLFVAEAGFPLLPYVR